MRLQCIAFGSYLEPGINGEIVLSLADQTFRSGPLGFYVETAALEIRDLVVESLETPTQADEHLAQGGSLGFTRRCACPGAL